MKASSYLSQLMHNFGLRQVPVWFDSSESISQEFQTIGKKLKLLRIFPNPFPFYDWIMGFYERVSNRAALHGTMLKRSRKIIDVGAGTGYLLSSMPEYFIRDRGFGRNSQVSSINGYLESLSI